MSNFVKAVKGAEKPKVHTKAQMRMSDLAKRQQMNANEQVQQREVTKKIVTINENKNTFNDAQDARDVNLAIIHSLRPDLNNAGADALLKGFVDSKTTISLKEWVTMDMIRSGTSLPQTASFTQYDPKTGTNSKTVYRSDNNAIDFNALSKGSNSVSSSVNLGPKSTPTPITEDKIQQNFDSDEEEPLTQNAQGRFAAKIPDGSISTTAPPVKDGKQEEKKPVYSGMIDRLSKATPVAVSDIGYKVMITPDTSFPNTDWVYQVDESRRVWYVKQSYVDSFFSKVEHKPSAAVVEMMIPALCIAGDLFAKSGIPGEEIMTFYNELVDTLGMDWSEWNPKSVMSCILPLAADILVEYGVVIKNPPSGGFTAGSQVKNIITASFDVEKTSGFKYAIGMIQGYAWVRTIRNLELRIDNIRSARKKVKADQQAVTQNPLKFGEVNHTVNKMFPKQASQDDIPTTAIEDTRVPDQIEGHTGYRDVSGRCPFFSRRSREHRSGRNSEASSPQRRQKECKGGSQFIQRLRRCERGSGQN